MRLCCLLEEGTCARFDHILIYTDVVFGHTPSSEASFESRAHTLAFDRLYAINGAYRYVDRIDHKAGDTVLDHLRNGAAAERDNWRAASHCLYHDEPKRLRPADREQQCSGIAKKVRLLPLVNLADVLDSLAINQWLYLAFEIHPIDFVDFCSDLQRQICRTRELDSGLRPLFRADTPEEGKIPFGCKIRSYKGLGYTVIDRSGPVSVWQRSTLRIRNRDIKCISKTPLETAI